MHSSRASQPVSQARQGSLRTWCSPQDDPHRLVEVLTRPFREKEDGRRDLGRERDRGAPPALGPREREGVDRQDCEKEARSPSWVEPVAGLLCGIDETYTLFIPGAYPKKLSALHGLPRQTLGSPSRDCSVWTV